MAVLVAVVVLVGAVYKVFVGAPPQAPMDDQAVAERLKPMGEVTVAAAPAPAAEAPAGESAAPAEAAPAATETAAAAPAAASGAAAGEAIYNKACIACHAAGVAGAPKLGDAAAWEPRIAKGIDALLQSAINGLNAMPPRGTCMDCSDDDLRNGIEFMISKAQ
ncbi:c-type cytochrome [Thioalbus denitrificans]|uniref:c-type cytochrome n=1 Tax=Thioalbus denitrificans TaxID=547122 RepID=UPI001B87D68A|nr:c-type cytochrome [Thioalbus denitrificans]